ncbi:MAG: AAA family ATPase [Betaproteobacteria bacterium]|nr:AAA family ATPase [Betaproteobacteria bacterium]
MYESFYGLTDKPFQLNPDPTFYFGSRQHRRAMAYLEYGLHQNEGFIVITGEVGAGKTTIVRSLLSKLDPQQMVAAQLVSTQLDADDMLRMVAAAFGLRTKDVSKSDLLLSLEAFLVAATTKGKRALLIVDEAQNLTPRAVEELRMLSNFQLETHALLQSFLVGQPEFRRTMQSPHMLQLRQRVIAACHIGPMDMTETSAYIEHRLTCVGWKGDPKFEPDAYEAIFAATGGIPRRINSVCDRVLLSGYLAQKRSFTRDDVDDVAREISEETFTSPDLVLVADADGPAVASPGKTNGQGPLKVGSTELHLGANVASEASRLIAGLQSSQVEDRLMRLERQADATLTLLQQLMDAIRNAQVDKENHP